MSLKGKIYNFLQSISKEKENILSFSEKIMFSINDY